MVALDTLVLPRKYRGVLVGFAAAVKIVPGAFVLLFLAVGDKRAALRAALTLVLTICVSWLVAPEASRNYWLHLFLATNRSGGGGYPDNQSFVGVVARLLHDDHPASWLTLPIQVAILGLSIVRARQAALRNDPLGALLAVAVGALLASPVSWSHHWVWCVPLIMHLLSRRRWIFGLAGCAVFTFAPLTLSPLGVLDDTPRGMWILTTMLIPCYALWWLALGWRTTTERSEGDLPPANSVRPGCSRRRRRSPRLAVGDSS